MNPSAPVLTDQIDDVALASLLAQLVRAESENPPGNEARAGEVAAERCAQLGLDVELHSFQADRPNVIARWGTGSGPVVGYCSHIDVVPAGDRASWERDPYGAEVADGRMHGRGTSDAKGPIAACLAAVAALQASGFEPRGTLELALVSDEEAGGFAGAAQLIEKGVTRPDVAIIGEPTKLKVVHAQRGIAWSRITVHGIAAHGSAPERGRNAIMHMTEILRALEPALPALTHPIVGGPTVNVGTIWGGDKVNMIPALCVVEIDRRTVPGETQEDILAWMEAAIGVARERYPDLDARPEIVSWGSSFEVASDARIVRVLSDAARAATGIDAELIGFRGTSDARFFAEAGAEVAVFGPGEIALAHTARESIDLDELRHGALAYALAFADLLGGS